MKPSLTTGLTATRQIVVDRMIEVKGRLATFEVAARDAIDAEARGRHTRSVVDKAKTQERLAAKAAKVKAVGA
jgi:fluoroacetyl-CoA thioesterase